MRTCPSCGERFEDASRFCPRDGETLSAPETDPYLGQTLIGQLEIESVAGRGSMGTVYRAWQAGMERPVAVKILRRELLRDPDLVKRFLREARSVARLSHPNIVTVHLVGETDDGVPFIAMELLEGSLLSEVVEAGPVDEARAVRIARQIASALADAHAGGIVHRDLKPANVFLLQRRRATDFVKILDFGIAKILGGSAALRPGESQLTREGHIFGTPHYMAPEQASGGEVDHRADLYSLGVILYRMAAGRLPFDGTGVQVLLAHVHHTVPPLATVAPHVAPQLAEIILRCLEKDPANRYASAEELADALDALAAGRALTPWAAGGRRSTGRGAVRSAPRPTPTTGPLAAVPARATTGSDAGTRTTGAVRRPSSSSRNVVSAELVPPRQEHRPPASRGLPAAAIGAAALVAASVAFAAYRFTRAGRIDAPPDDAAAAAPIDAGAPAPPGEDRRAVVVGEAGYSLRALLPPDMQVGVAYEIFFEVWDPSGQPIGAPELILTLKEPTGLKRGLSAKPAGAAAAGRYRFTRSFPVAGNYWLSVYPPAGDATIKVWFQVGAAPEAAAPAAPAAAPPTSPPATATSPTRPPKPPPSTTPGKPGKPGKPATPPPATPPATQPPATPPAEPPATPPAEPTTPPPATPGPPDAGPPPFHPLDPDAHFAAPPGPAPTPASDDLE